MTAVVLGSWTLSICKQINRSKRATDEKRLLNESILIDKSSLNTNELFVLAEKVAVCGLGHVHPAASLPENRGVHRSGVRRHIH